MKRSLIISSAIILAALVAVSILVTVHGHASNTSAYPGAGTSGKQEVSSSKDGNLVTIDNFSFTPATLTVPVGTSVTWTNHDDVPHTVVENDQKFKSKALDTDESFAYTFTEPGTYSYFCSVHPKMVAKVVVEAK